MFARRLVQFILLDGRRADGDHHEGGYRFVGWAADDHALYHRGRGGEGKMQFGGFWGLGRHRVGCLGAKVLAVLVDHLAEVLGGFADDGHHVLLTDAGLVRAVVAGRVHEERGGLVGRVVVGVVVHSEK